MPNRHGGNDNYRYGFNGKEKDDELKGEGNSIAFESRIYDSRVGRFLSLDPREVEYPWQSPFAYYKNSPIGTIDYLGMGDYYDKKGNHLGSDGKTKTITTGKGKNKKTKEVADDKAYIADSVSLEKGLVVAANNSKELDVSNSTLNKLANTVAEESSGNKEESFGIASAINNLSKYKGKDILSTLRTEGIYGYRNGGNNSNYNDNSEFGMAAAINALTGGHDYSNGAIRWDGDDLGRKGFSHVKPFTCGVEISQTDFDAYKKAYSSVYTNFSNNFSAGLHKATAGNVGRILYESRAVHGRTLFWGPNVDPIILTRPIICDHLGLNEPRIEHPNDGYRFDLKKL